MLAVAVLALALAGRTEALTFVSWVPASIVDHTSSSFREAFPFEQVSVERIVNKKTHPVDTILTKQSRPGRLVLEAATIRFYQPETRKTNPGIVMPTDSISVIDLVPSLNAIDALKAANPSPKPRLYCIRLEFRADQTFVGPSHGMVICTSEPSVYKYFQGKGNALMKATLKNGPGDHKRVQANMASPLFRDGKGSKFCEEIRDPSILKQATKWKKPRGKSYERGFGPKKHMSAANGAIFNHNVHLFRIGNKMRIAGYITGHSLQTPNGVVLSIRGSESMQEWQTDLDLMQDSFKERYRWVEAL